MENNIIRCVNEHLDIVESCFLNLEKLILTINNPDADIKNVHSVCREISLKETKADFSLQSVSVNASSLPDSEKIDIFSSTCDAIANRCEDFANGICRINKDMVTELSSDILEMLQKISCLFELMQQMFAAKEVGVLTEKIDSVETELDKYEENILKKIMSAPFSQSDKMQFMLYINKISKIPDVIKGNVKKVCKKT